MDIRAARVLVAGKPAHKSLHSYGTQIPKNPWQDDGFHLIDLDHWHRVALSLKSIPPMVPGPHHRLCFPAVTSKIPKRIPT